MKTARKAEAGDRRSAIGGKSFTLPSALRPPTSDLRPPTSGFTLFELLAVITIIGIVLSVTLGSFTGWGDAQAVRGSAEVIESALVQAHDYAVAQRVPVSFEYQSSLTNTLKKTAQFQLVVEPSMEAATNQTQGAENEGAQLLGSVQRLPGNALLVKKVVINDTSEDNAADRLVFLPNGKVCNPQTEGWLHLFVVSRKLRSDDLPNIVYRIDVDPVNGTATASKCDLNKPSSYSE
mgnify:CR=1 FL=1